MDPISLSTFRNAWAKFYPHVKVPEKKKFSKCAECCEYTYLKNKAKDPLTREAAQQLREQHWTEVSIHRNYTQKAIFESLCSDDIGFAQIDTMDCSKLGLPHIHEKVKWLNPEALLTIHATCVKGNGRWQDDVYLYTDCLPHDSATTVTIMYHTLLKVIKATPPPPAQCVAFGTSSLFARGIRADGLGQPFNEFFFCLITTGHPAERQQAFNEDVLPVGQHNAGEQEPLRLVLLPVGGGDWVVPPSRVVLRASRVSDGRS